MVDADISSTVDCIAKGRSRLCNIHALLVVIFMLISFPQMSPISRAHGHGRRVVFPIPSLLFLTWDGVFAASETPKTKHTHTNETVGQGRREPRQDSLPESWSGDGKTNASDLPKE